MFLFEIDEVNEINKFLIVLCLYDLFIYICNICKNYDIMYFDV